MNYSIKKLPEHTINKYKYSYLDHLETIIDLRDNYWDFGMQLYCINNSVLPLNSFTIDMQLPYQEARSIVFNMATDQGDVKEKVDGNKDYAKLLESKFIIDVSQNEYLKQDLQNAKINCIVNLQIDPQVIEKSGFAPDQADLDGLINETGEQRVVFALDYTNYYQIHKDGQIKNNYSYSLARHTSTCFSKVRLVNVQSDDLSQNTKAINHLTSLSSDTPFQVLVGKVKFFYWLDYAQEGQTLELDLSLDRSETTNIEINLNQNTVFDFIDNKVLIDPAGIKGFYIPKFATGYYELNLKVCQDGNIHTFEIKNDFNFIQNINNPYIAVGNIRIDDLTGFKEVIW